MCCASSARVTEPLEISVFIWSDLVLSAKSSKKCTPNHFWQVFNFFDSVYYRPNFYFYWRTLLSETTHINSASSASMIDSLEITLFIWDDQILATESSKKCTPNHFWQFSVFFNSIYYRPNFYFYWSTHLFESTHINCASSATLTKSLEISIFFRNDLVLAAKSSKMYTPNHFWLVFSFFWLSLL